LCPHSEHQNNPFQSKESKHFHQRNRFTKCAVGSNKVKLPKVGSNAIVPGPNKKEKTKLYLKANNASNQRKISSSCD
jgi:hypothetical protein